VRSYILCAELNVQELTASRPTANHFRHTSYVTKLIQYCMLGHLLRDDLVNPVKVSVRPSVRTYVRTSVRTYVHNQTLCSHKPNSGIC